MKQNTQNQDWFTVVNPNAGNRKGQKDWNRIADLLEKNNISFVVKFTERKGQAIEFTRDAVANGFRKFIAIGGDGTLNEMVNGIFTQEFCSPREITIGMIPVGTGNDWGRMFGIPLIYEGSVRVIRDEHTMLHDIGVVTYFNDKVKEKRYFINVAGLGFESAVIKRTNKQKDKGKSNKAIYFYSLLSSLITYRNTLVNYVIDGKSNTDRIFSINIGNGRYCGGGMRQTPDALPDDGLLDITVIKEISRFEIIRSLKLLYDGTILSHPKIDGYRSTNLSVDSESLLYLEVDGESLGHTPVEFSIIPTAVNIVYAKKLIP